MPQSSDREVSELLIRNLFQLLRWVRVDRRSGGPSQQLERPAMEGGAGLSDKDVSQLFVSDFF
jgi:hypothetical protein